MNNLPSIKFGDKDYALVPGRLKRFREENPRAAVDTEPSYNADGSITFKATIVKDQADPHSARATGTARYTENELKKPKAFEKLETISIGRSLSNIGYLNDGQIASTEEMEEFEQFQLEQVVSEIHAAKTREEFKAIMDKLKPEQKLTATPIINKRIKELKELANATSN